MTNFQTIEGDATHPLNEGESRIVIPHVVNDLGKWGRGFVEAVTKRWGLGPKQAYLAWADASISSEEYNNLKDDYNIKIIEQDVFMLGSVQFLALPNNVVIANMLAQHQLRGMNPARPPIRYVALARAMSRVAAFCDWGRGDAEIHCPKFGSGLAGGNWDFIHNFIQEVWADNDIPVTIYM